MQHSKSSWRWLWRRWPAARTKPRLRPNAGHLRCWPARKYLHHEVSMSSHDHSFCCNNYCCRYGNARKPLLLPLWCSALVIQGTGSEPCEVDRPHVQTTQHSPACKCVSNLMPGSKLYLETSGGPQKEPRCQDWQLQRLQHPAQKSSKQNILRNVGASCSSITNPLCLTACCIRCEEFSLILECRKARSKSQFNFFDSD